MVTRVTVLDTEVVMPDGVRLATDVFQPDDGHRHPVLLVRTPYGRGGARGGYDATGMARLGWAVVIQDVRGRWDSEGEFQPFENEADDGAATIAWCVSQPWSNGRVAMIGASYLGFVQWLAASRKPAGLVAIAPTVTAADIRDEATFEGGALNLGTFSAWTLGVGALGSNLDAGLKAESLQALGDWPGMLSTPLEQSVLSRIMPTGLNWLDYDDAERWERLDVSRSLGDLDLAGYHLAGWHDIFCEGNLNAFAALTSAERPESVRRRQRLVVGPWAHSTMLRRVTGELDFGMAAVGDFNGVTEEQVAFITAAVAGDDAGLPNGVRLFVMGDNEWVDFPSWPVPTSPVSLYLAGESRLTRTPPEETGADRWQHDPLSPVPNSGGRTLHPIPPEPGPLDQRAIEARDDVLVYTSDVLDHDLTVIGGVRAELYFESTAAVADVTVKLVDVHPDGRAMLVVDAIRRVTGASGRDCVEVEVGSTALTFKAGHQVRVEIASSNYPRYDLSPKAGQTIHHGGRAQSRLVLPVHTT